MEPIPCHNCICFALCNAKMQKISGVYKTNHAMRVLDRCSLFYDWAYQTKNPYSYRATHDVMLVVCKEYHMKFDIKPDTHLLRHIEGNGIWRTPHGNCNHNLSVERVDEVFYTISAQRQRQFAKNYMKLSNQIYRYFKEGEV